MSGFRRRQDLTFQYPCGFPMLREGNRAARTRVPPAGGGNLKEGVINCCFCEL